MPRKARGEEARRTQRARRIIQSAYGIEPRDSRVVRCELIADDIAAVRILCEAPGRMSVKVARAIGKEAHPLPMDSVDDCDVCLVIDHLESLYMKYCSRAGA